MDAAEKKKLEAGGSSCKRSGIKGGKYEVRRARKRKMERLLYRQEGRNGVEGVLVTVGQEDKGGNERTAVGERVT